MRRVWGSDLHVEARTIDVHINRLRNSLQISDLSSIAIQTIRSVGYCLKRTVDDVATFDRVSDNEVPDLKDTGDTF
jgi:DNA-binding winged helix-turn-helix (wHTH) protein